MKSLGPVNALYPMPVTLVGTMVNGRPNFLTVAHVGILNHGSPQYLSIGLHNSHYSNIGIRENKAFSICLPSRELMIETDYCGIMTGKNTDKSGLFGIFYGKTSNAPMIKECPINMELTLKDILYYGQHEIFVGELMDTHVSEDILAGNAIDIKKVNPLLFDMAGKKYWSMGEMQGNCWSAGKALKK